MLHRREVTWVAMNKEPAVPPTCAADDCAGLATLFHGGRPYCGKHALELLEKEGHAETPRDFMRSSPVSESEDVESNEVKTAAPA